MGKSHVHRWGRRTLGRGDILGTGWLRLGATVWLHSYQPHGDAQQSG
ncbi:MAG: hypothetical protein RBU30_17195 [Polyangia bacterium]|nr:hypothetical protein [Polyangia bacterium]